MQPTTDQDYKSILSEVIKKQIVILGPDITLIKARNVKGLTVSDDGTVTEMIGEPQTITQNLIDQFVQLSGLIVKKTMEPLLNYHPAELPQVVTPMPTVIQTQQNEAVITASVTNPLQSIDGQFHPDQVDAATQKIIDDALKGQKI